MADDRNILDPLDGDAPTSEFVQSLWERLDAAWDTGQDPDRPNISMDIDFPDPEPPRPRRKTAAIVTAAAAVILILMLAIVSSGDENGTDIIDQPEPDHDLDVPGELAPSSSTTVTTTTTTEAPPRRIWEFELTVYDVEGTWTLDASEDAAWGARLGGSQLAKLDLETNAVLSTVDISGGAAFVVVGDDSVWVGHDNGTLTRVDRVTETVVATINIGHPPGWIDVGVDSVWYGNSESEEVVRIDKATNEILARIPVGRSDVPIEGAGGVWLVDFDAAVVSRIDPATNRVVATIDIATTGPAGFGVGADAVWTGGIRQGIGIVNRISPDTNETEAVVDLGETANGIVITYAIESGGGSVWVRYSDCETQAPFDCQEAIARINTATNSVAATEFLPAGFEPGAIKIAPTTAWMTDEGTIIRIDFTPPPEDPLE